MQILAWQNRLYVRLLQESQQGALKRHCAYMAAGWLSFFGVRPKFHRQPAVGLGSVVGGMVLLLAVLWFSGPLLNVLQPALRAAGAAPGVTWVALALITLFVWRYVSGRRLLNALTAMDGSVAFAASAS